ncbi:F-box/FBD/LRR-repeat protein At1g78750-like [Pyrus x bretschneideri]|uniref:F-box/FBD/LRR-repeat protein At1g78750-like n=1 Tax=Pyrus x bretschneideri TaxID=225117 RepID=UPI00202FDD78|nr:F-box/FBD/LRR-repeat protein At1g78750-like [Pyrus x bretschneideri]
MDSKAKRQTPRDRISELPDAILCHLLSFLPTLHVVRTTSLYTRWNNLWCTSAPISLQFDSRDFSSARDFSYAPQQQRRFMRFVDGVMKLCGSSCNIRKLCLHCQSFAFKDEDFSCIHRWISTAIKNNVIELDLYLFSINYDFVKKLVEMPPSFYGCRSLGTLKLDTNYITFTSGCFPSLKYLHVTSHNSIIGEIFLNCPALEDLTIIGNMGRDVLVVNISAPQLKTLTTDTLECEFFVDAQRLENLHNLNQLELDLRCFCWGLVIDLLMKSPNLKHFLLNLHRTAWDRDYKPVDPSVLVPVCLSSHLKTISMRGFHGEQEEVEVLKYLLKYGEVLNKMTISPKNFVGSSACLTKEELCKEILLFQKGSETCQVEVI